jgi:lauroyl/myristoyl acyltransferase
MTKLVYWFFYALSLLPFRVLYMLSDMEFVLIYYVVRYRRKIVRHNLTTAFHRKVVLRSYAWSVASTIGSATISSKH